MSSSNSSCAPLFPETQVCTGRGVCVEPTGQCVCTDPSFTANGDFALLGSADCAIHITAIQVLWAVLLTGYVALFCLNVRYLWVKSRQRQSAFSPKVLGVLFGVSSVSFIVIGALKISAPSERVIGTDVFTTIFFSLGSGSFWLSTHVFIYSFVELVMKQAKMNASRADAQKRIEWDMKTQLPFSALVSLIACALPLFMLLSRDEATTRALAAAHYLLLAFELAFAGLVLCPRYVNNVTDEIRHVMQSNSTNKNVQLQKLVDKLLRFVLELRNQAMSNVVFALFMGCWPFLTTYGSSYFLCMAWTSGLLVQFLALYVHYPVTHKGPGGSSTNGGGTGTSGRVEGEDTVAGNSSMHLKPQSSFYSEAVQNVNPENPAL